MYNICTAFRKRSACLAPSVKKKSTCKVTFVEVTFVAFIIKVIWFYWGEKKTTHKNPKLFQTEEDTWGKEES